MERGTYFPLPVSVKKVSKEPPSERSFASGLGRPSGRRPCSSRYLGYAGQFVFEVYGGCRRRTAPTRCYQAGCRPGRCEDGKSVGALLAAVPMLSSPPRCERRQVRGTGPKGHRMVNRLLNAGTRTSPRMVDVGCCVKQTGEEEAKWFGRMLG
jgi:hypothetical protein